MIIVEEAFFSVGAASNEIQKWPLINYYLNSVYRIINE